ncbi:MAG: CBS domain-containing protein [Gemmatimonadota bacterium]
MRLTELLNERRILVPLPARSLAEAVQALVDSCVADGRVTDPARLGEVVRDSWPEDTVLMGPNAFVPHFRTDAVPALVVAIGVAPSALRQRDRGPREARIVLLVVAPPSEAAEYLQTVAAFARVLSRPEVVEALHQAGTATDVLRNVDLDNVVLEGPLVVRDIMTPHVYSVAPDALLSEAASLLLLHHLDALPVVGASGEVVGLISNAEMLRYLVPSYVQQVNTGKVAAVRRAGGKIVSDPRQLPVREAMARNVFCLSEDQTIAEAATLMAHKNLDGFPVVREGILTGFLTRSDIVRKVIGRP